MSTVKDIYGEVNLDKDSLWGVNTQRSLQNFPIGLEKMPKSLIEALLTVKSSCAVANEKAKVLSTDKSKAIQESVNYLLSQEDLMKYFPLSIWQTGSGTQTNMNANEVISKLSGDVKLHPNDDVNKGQSSNDVFPTAMNIMAVNLLRKLIDELDLLIEVLSELKDKYSNLIKVGRTHTQDATPLTYGQEISAWEMMIRVNKSQLESSLEYLYPLAIGGTAVGNGVNTFVGFDQLVVNEINKTLNEQFVVSVNKYHQLSSKDGFVFASGALNSLASNVMKMANDLRFLASGPRAGLREITLPANEAGSSIMPGKVNPTQIEALTMVCVQVMGNTQTITIASSQGHFQLNTFMPVITYNFYQAVTLLTESINSFRVRCLKGIEVNTEVVNSYLNNSLMSATYLNPILGYDVVSKLVKEAHVNNLSIKEVVLKNNLMSEKEFDDYFDYSDMIKPYQIEEE